jgi:hypothetical protein
MGGIGVMYCMSYVCCFRPVRASQSNYRLPGLVSSLVGGWARSQMPPSVAQSIPLLGVQSMPKVGGPPCRRSFRNVTI